MGCVSHKTYVAIVEDDESLSRSLARLLRVSGYQAVNYPSAECFLEDSKRPVFDCLVVDIQLEGISGIELNEHLASTGSTTPVVFVTAHERADELEQSLRSRCAALVRKSDPGEVLLIAIDEAIQASDASGTCNFPAIGEALKRCEEES